MRLIDIDALIEEHCKGCSEDVRDSCKTDPVCATLMWFEDAPTIDAVPVVRCKDCEYYEMDECVCPYICMSDGAHMYTNPDDYCSYGERKEGDDEDR